MMTTNSLSSLPSLTLEQFWQVYQEDVRQRQEDARQLREDARQRQKEWQAFLDQKKEDEKERKREAKKLEEQMKRTDAQLGKLGNRFGEMVEHLVAPGIAKLFNKRGYHFHGVYFGELEFKDENGNLLTEVDILLENDESIIAVEVKAKPCTEDIPYHIERLKILQQYFKKHRGTRKKIIGAIAGAIFTESVKKAVIKKGLYVIAQSGDTIKIDVPKDFRPTLF